MCVGGGRLLMSPLLEEVARAQIMTEKILGISVRQIC